LGPFHGRGTTVRILIYSFRSSANAFFISVGDAAKAAFHAAPAQTVFDAKRLIGRKDEDAKLKRDMKHWPFKVVNKGGKPMIQVQNKAELKDFVRFYSF
jgi:molecular chaperone DnaK (HSP70)